MFREEYVEQLNKYGKSISFEPPLQTHIIAMNMRTHGYIYQNQNINYDIKLNDMESFIQKQKYFKPLLKDNSDKLCTYLLNIHNYTYTKGYVRMNVRSKNLQNYQSKVLTAINDFYIFYGCGLNVKSLVYGEYRELNYDFSSIIAAELIGNNKNVEEYCKNVLTSDNNVGVLTRDVIVGIEKSNSNQLHDLLEKLLLAAKLQEGLRQSIIESVDENNVDFYLRIVKLVKSENLIRFVSVQRGIMTWLSIGYGEVKEKEIKLIFDTMLNYLENEDQRKKALSDDNPLFVYLALHCKGIYCVEDAVEEANELLKSAQQHIIEGTLVYLKNTQIFNMFEHRHLLEEFKDNDRIIAMFLSCCQFFDFNSVFFKGEEIKYFIKHFHNYISTHKRTENFKSKGFAWFQVSISRDEVANYMFKLLELRVDKENIDFVLPHLEYLHPKAKERFLKKYFDKGTREIRVNYLINSITSSSNELVKMVEKELLVERLSKDELLRLIDKLTTKKTNSKSAIITILANQNPEIVKKIYDKLISSNSDLQVEAGRELKSRTSRLFGEDREEVSKKKDLAGSFTVGRAVVIHDLPYENKLVEARKSVFSKKKVDLSVILVWSKEKTLQYLKKWGNRVKKHENDEFYDGREYRQIKSETFHSHIRVKYSDSTLNGLALADVWRGYFVEDNLTADELFALKFLVHCTDSKEERLSFINDSGYFTLMDKEYQDSAHYSGIVNTIISSYCVEKLNEKIVAEKSYQLLQYIVENIKEKTYEYWGRKTSIIGHHTVSFLMGNLQLRDCSSEEFRVRFPLHYKCYVSLCAQMPTNVLSSEGAMEPYVVARAVVLGLLPIEALYDSIMWEEKGNRYEFRAQISSAYRYAYLEGKFRGWRKTTVPTLDIEKYKLNEKECDEHQKEAVMCLRNALDEISDTLLDIEKKRIIDQTPTTKYIKRLDFLLGVKYLKLALEVLRKEAIVRDNGNNSKAEVFAEVIRNSYPLSSEDYQEIMEMEIAPSRLVEVAMLAPQWIDSVEKILGWEGFKEACYYFIAHMKQYDADRKKAEIAHFTSLEPADLNDGAFDLEWCKRVYETLGEKRFKMLYDSAKFLCENSFHVRARKYADACLGKSNLEQLDIEAHEKRNRDSLNAYCVYPIKDDKELLERYLSVQQFLKESKKFGAQRQTSEKRSGEIALDNLARNSRFVTKTRLTWFMESAMVKENEMFLKPQMINDIEMWIEIDEIGNNSIKIAKGGKVQKSIPSALKNNEVVLEIQSLSKKWKEQSRRARDLLQVAMEQRTLFFADEFESMMQNPIVAPMLKKLVLKQEKNFGFYDELDLANNTQIAHPYDLFEASVWHKYQKDIFDRKLVQPFKQVFRELYLKLEDELDQSSTKRYTGYQVQVQKVKGTLKSRKWNVNYETGMEKVYYAENIVVNLYADADWFSPNDIESPSIDYVAFYDRKNHCEIAIKDIDDVIFSEVMRDIDLAVSVGYVGGVDPITSFATMELRNKIVEYTVDLMKLTNVTLQEHFANIKGTLNDYSVHLGSGMVHQSLGGAIHMVAIHNSKRGKVYLPFLDEDPKTAEIISKIVLLAEDDKLKDPSILSQITTKK